MKAIDRLLIPLFHAPIKFFIFIISEYSNNEKRLKDKSYKFCDTLYHKYLIIKSSYEYIDFKKSLNDKNMQMDSSTL